MLRVVGVLVAVEPKGSKTFWEEFVDCWNGLSDGGLGMLQLGDIDVYVGSVLVWAK